PHRPAEDSARLVDALGSEIGARALSRPEQRRGPAQRDEEPDLEVVRLRECRTQGGGAERSGASGSDDDPPAREVDGVVHREILRVLSWMTGTQSATGAGANASAPRRP